MSVPEWIGKSEGYVTLAGACVLIATGLCAARAIDGSQWVQATVGIIGIVCAGGAASAYRK